MDCVLDPAPHIQALRCPPVTPSAGLWLAPQMVGEALKGGRLAAQVLSREGFNVIPAPGRSNPWSFITGEQCLVLCVSASGQLFVQPTGRSNPLVLHHW